MSASVGGNPVVTGQCLVPHKIEHTEFVRQRPGFGFIDPHQRSVNDELFIHRQVQGDIQRLDERIPAIGIMRPGTKVFGNESLGLSSSIEILVSVNELLPRLPIKEVSIT